MKLPPNKGKTMQKTKTAQALENLNMSEATANQAAESADSSSERSPSAPQSQDYAALNDFGVTVETESEPEQSECEEITEEDANALAAYGANTAADFIESSIRAPITIDHETREAIAIKAAPVVAKYTKGGKMPDWLVRWREEIELGLVLGGAALSVYKQIKAYERSEAQKEKEQGEGVTNGS